jgi:bifunctional non-homologous end joining protein LigD
VPGEIVGKPGFLAPMLLTSARTLPTVLEGWSAEPKLDGMRVIVRVHRGEVTVWSRTGRDVTGSFPEFGAIAEYAGRRTLLLDGELVVVSGERMHVARPSADLAAEVPVVFAAFDLLHVATRSLLSSPFQQRRMLLSGLNLGPGAIITPVFPGPDASDVFRAAEVQGLEGIVLKRLGSTYVPGKRTRNWVKIKVPSYRRPQ